MSSRRTMILVAAIAVGVVAAFVLFNYISGVEDRANENTERVRVLMVAADIEQGFAGDEAVAQNLIVEEEIPRQFLPASRITDLDQISGKVALSNLAANQVLVDGMFVDPVVSQLGFGQRLDDDLVAISVSVDEVRGVAGLLVPGDLVNIFELPEVDPRPPARLVYHQARVLAIGQQAAPQPGESTAVEDEEGAAPPAAGVLTLAVPIDAAQLIASIDGLYLTLTGPDYQPQPVPRIEPGELQEYPAEANGRSRFGELTPYGPDGPQ